MQAKPNFYSILPANVRYAGDLSSTQKIIFSEIAALCDMRGVCTANNAYFAKCFEMSAKQASKNINYLHEKGYVNITYGDKREITPIMDPRGRTKVLGGVEQKVNHNNTNINIINNINPSSEDEDALIMFINSSIEKLNDTYEIKLKTIARGGTKKLAPMRQRIKEHGLDICKKVWTEKVNRFKGTDFHVYIRPETIFQKTKFEQILPVLSSNINLDEEFMQFYGLKANIKPNSSTYNKIGKYIQEWKKDSIQAKIKALLKGKKIKNKMIVFDIYFGVRAEKISNPDYILKQLNDKIWKFPQVPEKKLYLQLLF